MFKENHFFQILAFLIKISLFNLVTIKNIRNLNTYISEVHLVIKGRGRQEILNSAFYTVPSEVK